MSIHAIFYRVGLITLSTFVLVIFGFVLTTAFKRQSGVTGLDASKLMQMREEGLRLAEAEDAPDESAQAPAS